MNVRCPSCRNPIEFVEVEELHQVCCPSCGSSFSLVEEGTLTFRHGGQTTVGRFELLEQVGVGAFGCVWKARDTELDRIVAVKLPREQQLTSIHIEQFFREARSAAQLSHPGIVSVHEVGREDGSVYIVSDFVEGLPLSSLLTAKQPTVREAAELAAKLADALHHAHEAGVVHRDLKPSDVMIDSKGDPRIMDFGLAKRDAGELTMTMDGQILGTPAYMSPEQARGEASSADRRTDIYSLGVMLFEMLTGERPFRGDHRMLLHQVLNEEAPSPRSLRANLPRDIETLCLKCLEKQPDNRYADARQVADELRRFLAGEPIAARPLGRTGKLVRWCRRNPRVAALSTTIVAILLAVSVLGSLVAVQQTQLARRLRTRRYTDLMNLAYEAWRVGDLVRLGTLLDSAADVGGTGEFEFRLLRQLHERDRAPSYTSFTHPVTCVVVSPHDGAIAIGLSSGEVKLCAADFSPIRDLEPANANLRDSDFLRHRSKVTFTSNGLYVIAACSSESQDRPIVDNVKIWEADTKMYCGGFEHDSAVLSLDVSPDGKYGASRDLGGSLKLWSLPSGEVLWERLQQFPRGKTSLSFTPDSSSLVLGSPDGTVSKWNIDGSEHHLASLGHEIQAVRFSPDGTSLAIATDIEVRLWRLGNSDLVPMHQSLLTRAWDLRFSESGE